MQIHVKTLWLNEQLLDMTRNNISNGHIAFKTDIAQDQIKHLMSMEKLSHNDDGKKPFENIFEKGQNENIPLDESLLKRRKC